MRFGSREHAWALREMERAAEKPVARAARERRETSARHARAAEYAKARDFLDRLSSSERRELEDQVAEGDFRWEDWLREPPSEAFWDEILGEFGFLD